MSIHGRNNHVIPLAEVTYISVKSGFLRPSVRSLSVACTKEERRLRRALPSVVRQLDTSTSKLIKFLLPCVRLTSFSTSFALLTGWVASIYNVHRLYFKSLCPHILYRLSANVLHFLTPFCTDVIYGSPLIHPRPPLPLCEWGLFSVTRVTLRRRYLKWTLRVMPLTFSPAMETPE